MLTLDSISPIHFSRNPILLNFTATDVNGLAYRATGAGAALITDATNLPQGAWLTIGWTAPDQTSHSETFVINNDLINPNHIPSNPISMAGYIQANAKISPHFFVQHADRNGESWIIIEARDATAGFLVSIGHGISVSSPYSIRTETWLPTPTTKPDDYLIQVIIYFEESFYGGKWRVAKTFEIEIEDDGTVTPVDISQILNNECERTITENPFAKYTESSPTLTDNIRRWTIQYRETLPNSIPGWASSDTYFVMNAGLPQRIFLQEDFNFWNSRNISNSLLTYKNNVRTVIRGQKHFISWYNFHAETKIARLKIVYWDGIQNTTIYRYGFEILARFTVTFPISPQALNLPSDAMYYSVSIETTTGEPLCTQTVYCIINTKYYRSVRTIGYINAFGCPETQLVTGDFSKAVNIDRLQSTGTRYDSYGRSVLVSKQKRAQYQITFTYRTGVITSADSEQLSEIELSPVLFDLTGSLQLALSFRDARFTKPNVTDTGETIFEKEIIAIPRIDNVSYAPDNVIFTASTIQNVLQSVGSNGTGVYTPTDPTNTGGNGNGGTVIALGSVQDTDKILFAQVNAQGQITGFQSYTAGEFMRQTRGIPTNSPTHLDGLGYMAPDGSTWIETIDNVGDKHAEK